MILVQVYTRLHGISGGKMSGSAGQVWEGSSGDLHKASEVLKDSLTLSTFYQGKWLGREETEKAKVSTI